MNLEEKQKFFAHRPNATTVHMDGKKLALANLPEEARRKVLDRLAEKDEVMAQGKKGILPGLKIDGKQVTRDNIHEFEKSPSEHKEKPEVEVIDEKDDGRETVEVDLIKEIKFTKKELEAFEFKKLKVIGNKLGTTDRSKKNLIKEILKLQ